MRYRTRTFAVAALAAVLLTGCTATAEPDPGAAGPEGPNSPAATAPEAAPAARGNVEPVITGVWAGVKDDQFLETAGDTYSGKCGGASTPAGLRACAPFEPFAYVSAVESPRPGDLLVTVIPEAWGGGAYDPDQYCPLEYVASKMAHHDDVKTLAVTTPNGSPTCTDYWQPHYASVLGS